MRTTITLEPDVAALVQQKMKDTDSSFRDVVNRALRNALAPTDTEPYRTPTFHMGTPTVDLTKALQLAGELEDAEIVRKMGLGK